MCLCYLFSAKTAWQLVNRKADFLHNESIRVTNQMDSSRELECSTNHTLIVLLSKKGDRTWAVN